ncbi:MAG: DNA repair protein RecO [Vicinamibacteria bacterium]|nr:DNA repair protein RecO [Vicinamibacteria bacterium]
MPPFTSDALVLRTFKLGETSKVVVLLTRDHGKLRAVARGARGPRSRYQSSLETLSEVRVGLYGRQGADLLRVGECELLRSAFPMAGRGPDAAAALSYFAELLDAFAQEAQTEDAVYRLAVAVTRAGEDGGACTPLARYLEAWLLRLHGLYPSIDRCARCDGALPGGRLVYHSLAHGFICDGCSPASGPILSEVTRQGLRRLFKEAPATFVADAPPALESLEAFHRALIERHLERELRSLRVFRELSREVTG